MRRATRPCINCGTLTRSTRCAPCQRTWDRTRNANRTQYHGNWERHSRQTRAAWIAEHGHVCPGYNKPAHPAQHLQLDHTTGLVLCGPCNVAAGPADH